MWLRFLGVVLGGFAAIGALVFLAVVVADPYGVSPIGPAIPHFNTTKLARVDIDRYLKPYEVWRYQPKTVFLGTSRINQSFDAAALDGSEFAPAYNAAIPASTIAENARHLERYFESAPGIKHVFQELFLYNFILGQPEPPPFTVSPPHARACPLPPGSSPSRPRAGPSSGVPSRIRLRLTAACAQRTADRLAEIR